MKIFPYLTFINLILFNGCTDDILNCEIPNDALVRPIIFLSPPTSLDSIDSDEISIYNIQIVKDILVIDATYPDGCEPHSITLFSRSGFQETNPVQLPMKLVQYAFSDTCTQIITERFYFDLKSVGTLYKIGYRSDNGSVLLSIYDSDSTSFYLPHPIYEF